jgi:branched-chain amino acid transport system ATP-binding protein
VIVPALGVSWGVFIGVAVVLFGFAALMTGQALAQTWRPWWHAVPYSALLGAGAQFVGYALFEGRLVFTGWLIDFAVLLALASLAYRVTLAHKMVAQYPWLYERAGLFAWRQKSP